MAEPSTGALAVTGVLASVGLGAFPQLYLAALVGAFGGAFSTWRSPRTSALGAVLAIYWLAGSAATLLQPS